MPKLEMKDSVESNNESEEKSFLEKLQSFSNLETWFTGQLSRRTLVRSIDGKLESPTTTIDEVKREAMGKCSNMEAAVQVASTFLSRDSYTKLILEYHNNITISGKPKSKKNKDAWADKIKNSKLEELKGNKNKVCTIL